MKNGNQEFGKMSVEITPNDVRSNSRKNKLSFKNLTKDQKETLLTVGIGAGLIAGTTAVGFYAIGGSNEKATFGEADEVGKVIEQEEALVEDAKEATPEAAENAIEESVDDYGNATEIVDVYTDAPISTSVTDDMNFDEAFATARAEIGGGGGFFTWNGDLYNTYTAEEWEAMYPGEQEQYVNSISESSDMASYSITEGGEYVIDQTDILGEIDYSQDGIVDGYIVDVNNNGIQDVVVDLDGDHQIDELIIDVENQGENVQAIEVNPLGQSASVAAKTIQLTEDDIIESANITGDDAIEAVLVDTDGDNLADIGFDSDADGSIDVVVVDLGTPTQEIIEIDALQITEKMYEVEVPFDNELEDVDYAETELEEEFELEDVDGLTTELDDLDIDLGDDEIDYSEFS